MELKASWKKLINNILIYNKNFPMNGLWKEHKNKCQCQSIYLISNGTIQSILEVIQSQESLRLFKSN